MTDVIYPIRVFVDESYLDGPDGRTGTIQSIVTLGANHYGELLKHAARLLDELPDSAKEFKGKNVNRHTRPTFAAFVKIFRNLAAFNAYRYDLKTLFTIDGVDNDKGADAKWVYREVEEVLAECGLRGNERLKRAFSQQLNWFIDHFPAISGQSFTNPLYVFFDNRSDHAEAMSRTLVEGIQVETVYTEAARRVLPKAGVTVHDLRLFSFRKSEEEIGIQAADLFSHLLFNYLKAELGYQNRTTSIKAQLMRELLPSLNINASDLAHFELVNVGEQKVPVILNQSLSLQFRLEAPSEQEVERLFGGRIEPFCAG